MAMGHMNQRRRNIRSTSNTPIEKQPTPDTDLGTNTHLVYAVIVDQGHLYTDLTGKFPVRSSKGNSYVMVCYVYDCKYVKVIPMKSRSASEWVKAYDTVHIGLCASNGLMLLCYVTHTLHLLWALVCDYYLASN
jgi:hypothetical protein